MGSARNRNGSFIFLREWYDWMVEGKVQGVRCIWGKRRTWSYKSSRWFKISVRHHTRAQMAFIAIKWTLFCWRETTIFYDIVVSNCLFMTDWRFPEVIYLILAMRKKHSTNCSQEGQSGWLKTLTLKGKSAVILWQQSLWPKTTIRITWSWRLFFVCSLCLFTFSITCSDAYHAITIRAWNPTGFLYLPGSSKKRELEKSLQTCCIEAFWWNWHF